MCADDVKWAVSPKNTPGGPSLCEWAGRTPGTPLLPLYPGPPGRRVSSWSAPPPASEKTDWPPVGPASQDPHSAPSPAAAAPPAHTPNSRTEASQHRNAGLSWFFLKEHAFILDIQEYLFTPIEAPSDHIHRVPYLSPSLLREAGQQ